MNQPPIENRSAIIDAIRNPLSFLVLGLLLVDGTLAGLAIAIEKHETLLVYTIVISIPAFVLVVVGLAVWRPEALRGDRPLQEVYAKNFATDLFVALDGSLRNLTSSERMDAWATAADIITNDTATDASYSSFCLAVAERLNKLAVRVEPM